jgi:hypothetical protein
MDEAPIYKPRHHHLARHQGSSTGGVSQIIFGNESENMPPPPIAHVKERSSYAVRNASSSIFDFAKPAQPQPVVVGRARVVAAAAQASSIVLTHEPKAPEPDLGQEPPYSARARPQAETPRNNPIFGGAFDAMSSRQDAPLDRPMTAPQRSHRDPNRSSVAGGIFGTDTSDEHEATSRFHPRRHLAIEHGPVATYCSKRYINGRIEYCA